MNEFAAMMLAAAVAFGLTVLLGFPLIPWLRKLKIGQTILDIGPKWHKAKQGIPTMGGIMIALGSIAAMIAVVLADTAMSGTLVTGGKHAGNAAANALQTKLWSGVLMAVAFGLVGFLDDYVKVVKKQNKGLSIRQKTLAQIVVTGAYLLSLYLAAGGNPTMFLPFFGDFSEVKMGFFFWIFGAVVLYATTNAVNLTDGIDGLCATVTTTVALALAVIAVMRGLFGFGVAASALAGACIGFLVWNWNPAKIIMGDTGSMFLGGMVAALAYALDVPWILLLVGLIYVIEGLSDVIQIGYFRATGGKRVFKMAPIHHHFEMSGWGEKKIVRVFTLANLLGCAAGIAVLYWGGYSI